VRRGGVQDGGKGFDGGKESVALDILRQLGMGEWNVQVMLQSRINLAGTHAASKAGPRNAGSFRKRQSIPALALAVNIAKNTKI
jgi:hypothetical protein